MLSELAEPNEIRHHLRRYFDMKTVRIVRASNGKLYNIYKFDAFIVISESKIIGMRFGKEVTLLRKTLL